MSRLHVRIRKDHTHGIYKGKRCLAYGDRDSILDLAHNMRAKRKSKH